MENYDAGMLKSASLALQEALDEALEKLHPRHGILTSLSLSWPFVTIGSALRDACRKLNAKSIADLRSRLSK